MFSALGYIPFRDLFHKFQMTDLNTKVSHGSTDIFRSIPQENVPRLLREASPADLVEGSLLDSIARDAYLCSPTGAVLKFDLRSALEYADFWDFTVFDVMRTEDEHSNCEAMPEHFYLKYNLIRYPFDDLTRDMNEDKQGPLHFLETSGLEFQNSKFALFYDRVGYTISFDAFDFIRRAHNFIGDAEFLPLKQVLFPFCGWSICVKEDYAKEQWLADYRKAFARRGHASTEPSAGRPAIIRRKTKEAYEALFPQGHKGKPWLAVLRLVNQRTGYSASVDTLKRAIRASS
ncbi:hypothetical protein CK224_19080 [Mesorhizobium sp. WSM3862]|nr:hypothetical protein CK224_19080 [Mesorhizobium sp. WSM3862]